MSKNLKLLKTGKRHLYLDRNKKFFIEFDLEKTKTCEEIYKLLQNEIEKKIKEIYKNITKENINFNFIIIYSTINNKFDYSLLTEIKINKNTQLTEILQNNQSNLYYIPIIHFNIKKNIKIKSKEFICKKNEEVNNINTINDLEKYLTNEGIYYFDKKSGEFIYGKGTINEQRIIINIKKVNIEILISQIKSDKYFENEIPLSLQVFQIKCPNYIFEIRQNNTTHIFGLYKQKSYLLWKNSINSARIKNKARNIDSNFNYDINNISRNFYLNCYNIPSKCEKLNQILENPEKRKIFLNYLDDRKISDITSNIFAYKMYLDNNEFISALACLKQITFYIDFDNIENEKDKKLEMEKYSNIFYKEKIELYKNVLKEVNNVLTNMKQFGEETNNVLKNIFKKNLFDNLYYQIYDKYILPFFQNFEEIMKKEYKYDEKPIIIKKLHLLMSKYTMNYFDMNEINNFNCLCNNNNLDMDNNLNNIRNNSNEYIRNISNDININVNDKA